MLARQVWRTYFFVAGILLGGLLLYTIWLSHTCRACATPVRLDRAGVYELESRMFAAEHYLLSFDVRGLEPAGSDWFERADLHLWRGAPPLIDVEIRDAAGHVMLRERGTLEKSSDWIVSGWDALEPVKVYKFTNFAGRPLRKYSITLKVLEGSLAAKSYDVTFEVIRTCEYEGIAYLLWLAMLFLVLVLGAGLVVIFLRLAARRG